ncbi:hypothetical protein BEN47_09050 [Hymenobacter lapidarius]|uniref:Lipoprotein n=1 Tax=Hymenobacter lapidarius TaxID=1908237 RepID=A0A1G1TBH9_9BACT|nr:DUF6252 family protein [Hymenobacter lapidarius]OGX88227.1 hypothetical protein BEN47_09050 [Hymenobacter lapidarius]
MPAHYARFRIVSGWFLLALALTAGAGCTLTTAEVEPELPTGRVSDGNTLVYRADGLPVVAHNDTSLGTILISTIGGTRPVVGRLYAGTAVVIRARDSQNEAVVGQQQHELQLELLAFQGVGTYTVALPGSFYQASPYPNNQQAPAAAQTYYPAGTAAARVVVTEWNATTRQLRGTFAFTATAPATGQAVALTEGRFDLILDQ